MNQGKLILFAGPACSGKSSLGQVLSVERRWPHLAMDATRVRVLPESQHARADRAVAYRAMHLAAELLLSCGVATILDAPYGHREDREDVAAMLVRTGAPMRLIECAVTPEAAVGRFRIRTGTHPGLDLNEDRVRQLARDYRFSNLGLFLDTSRLDISECLSRVRTHVDGGDASDPIQWVEASPE